MAVVRSQFLTRSVSSSPLAGAKTDDVVISTDTRGWPNASGTKPLPAILVHGAGFRVTHMVNDPTYPNYAKMVQQLAEYFTLYVSDFGGDWWGSPDHLSRIGDAKTYMESNWGTSGPVTLIGFSMGGLGSLNYAKANPSLVRAVACLFPVVNLSEYQAANDPTGNINNAYSGGYTDGTYGANHNPAIWASSLSSSVPVKIMYSDTDPVISVSSITTFKTNRPSTRISMVGHNGHTDLTIADSLPELMRFVRYLD